MYLYFCLVEKTMNWRWRVSMHIQNQARGAHIELSRVMTLSAGLNGADIFM